MGLFGRGKSGGVMNVIRCDLDDYLVWKWRPNGQDANSTTRENSIRWDSSLRVKDGEVAVFVYKQKDGTMQDFITGPFDQTLKTANLPILSSIVGLAFGGESPFQAEVYYINIGSTIQVKFGVPFFDIADPRFMDYAVPVSSAGTLTFAIQDYKDFIKKNRLVDFSLQRFSDKIKDIVTRRVKTVIGNAPIDMQIPVLQIERKIDDINDAVAAKLKLDLEDFGIAMTRLDISRITLDKESEGWSELHAVTADIQSRTMQAQADVNIRNMNDMQAINAENAAETMRIQREEAQRAQRLQTESAYLSAHALDQQTSVLNNAASNLGQMASMGGGNGGGMNPAAMMTGMMMGGAVAQQMGASMQQMNANMQAGMNPGMQAGIGNPMGAMPGTGMTPPPMPGATPQSANVMFMIAIGTQQAGPFSVMQLQQLMQNGSFNAQTLVWRQGMPSWVVAAQVPELASLFATAPAMPGMPPMPGAGTPMPPPMP